jgi:hypothetical protein
MKVKQACESVLIRMPEWFTRNRTGHVYRESRKMGLWLDGRFINVGRANPLTVEVSCTSSDSDERED